MATKRKKSIPLEGGGIDWSTLVLDPPKVGSEPVEQDQLEPSGPMRRYLGDTTASVVKGAVQGVRMITDTAGADNAVSTGLRSVEDFIGGLQSAEARRNQQEIARILKEAEGKGVLDQVIAGARAFSVAPMQTMAQAAGTAAPTIAAAFIPGVGPAAAAARIAAPLGVGAVQGAGTVKASIYDAVKQRAIEEGRTPAEAEQLAVQAQEYGGENSGQIALGAGLGAWAGKSGLESAAARLVHGTGGKAVPSMAARVATGAAAEAIPEAAQGGQEKFASNVAQDRAGFQTDPWSGVAAGATMEALAGAAMGGALGVPAPSDAPTTEPMPPLLPETGPMSRAANAATIAARGQPLDFTPTTIPGKGDGLAVKDEPDTTALDFEADPRFAGSIAFPNGKAPEQPLFASKQLADVHIGEQGEFGELMPVEAGAGQWTVQQTPEAANRTSRANIERWMTQAQPMEEAQAKDMAKRAESELNKPMTALPMPDGTGWTVVPRQWVSAPVLLDYTERAAAAAQAKGEMEAEAQAARESQAARVQEVANAPVDRAPRTPRADAVEIDPAAPNAVAQFIAQQATVNTPAARAFVQDYRAGRVTDADVLARITPKAAAEPTADERLAAAAQAGQVESDSTPAGLILNREGKPFKTEMAAAREQKKHAGSTVVAIEGGHAVQPAATESPDAEVEQAAAVPEAAAQNAVEEGSDTGGVGAPAAVEPGSAGGAGVEPRAGGAVEADGVKPPAEASAKPESAVKRRARKKAERTAVATTQDGQVTAPDILAEIEAAGVGSREGKREALLGHAQDELRRAEQSPNPNAADHAQEVERLNARIAALEWVKDQAVAADQAEERASTERAMLRGARQELDTAVASGKMTEADGQKAAARAGATGNAADAADEVFRSIDDAEATAAPASVAGKPETIADIGEKIGGARKDMSLGGGTKRRASADSRPAWARRFEVSQIVTPGGMVGEVKDAGRWVIRDTRSLDWMKQPRQVGRDTYATKEEAEAFVPIAAVSLKHRAVPTRDGKYEIWRDITDRKRVKVVDKEFATRDEAIAYMAAHAADIIETNTTFGEADMPLPPDRARSGPTRRDGNVKGEDFKETFGLRAVEFGNWNNQDDRQSLMNDAWDGLLDLADVLGIPPKAIGLNGDLALAFGARGHGLQGARAHYELDRAVINLTKEKGAGSLAHEWFHALDHYFGRQDGKASATWQVGPDGTRTLKVGEPETDMASGGFQRNNSGVRPEVRTAYETLLRTMFKKAEGYVEDMTKVDKFTGEAREELAKRLNRLRAGLSEQLDPKVWKRNNKPATAEQLAEFDAIAAKMVAGESLSTDWRTVAKPGNKTGMRRAAANRWTNDALEQLGTIYKDVRGRSGFTADRDGTLDDLRGYMERYGQRLKMLADAQTGTEKTRQVPTEFAMNAKELDQGRGTDYWTTPHEMVARAFQGYVEDKIAEQGGVSRFLNYGPENAGILTPWGFKRPFPAGAERTAINKAFDGFVGELKTQDTDKGVALFSRSKAVERPQVTIEKDGSGFPLYVGDKVRLEFPQITERIEVIETDGEQVVNYPIMSATGFDVLGYVELLVKGGQATALLDIEVKQGGRKAGVARDVIEALLAADPSSSLDISNIVPEARGFWEKMGIPQQNVEGAYDGNLNWKTYADAQNPGAESQDAGASRAAREGADAGTEGGVDGASAPARSEGQASAGRRQAVEALVARIAARWRNAPEVIVLAGMNDPRVPRDVLLANQAQLSQGALGAPEGFFHGGKVYLVAPQLGGDADVVRVLFHESLGHFGLRGTFGPELGTILDRLAVLNAGKVRAKAKQYGLDYDKPSDRRLAAEEVLAEMAQRAPDVGWAKKAVAAIRTWLRQHVPGFSKMALSDEEIVRSFLLPARAFVQKGGAGAAAAADAGAAFSRSVLAGAVDNFSQAAVRNAFLDAVTTHGSTNFWGRTVGTQYHKAQSNPKTFGRVFDAVQDYIKDTSAFANKAADLAPSLLPKLDTAADLLKDGPLRHGADPKDKAKAGEAIFQGTLEKVLYDDATLKRQFGLTPKQVELYREFRAAVDQSLEGLGKTEILRIAGAAGAAVRDDVLAAATLGEAADILNEQLAGDEDTAQQIADKVTRIAQLQAEGYAPLTRFGKHTLHVTGPDGATEFFGMYETVRDANKAARQLRGDARMATMTFTQGVMSQEGHKLFNGLSMDSLELFADATGNGDNPVYQAYLKLAVANRSALKRMIERKGIAGYSDDVARVLASFVTSNARMSAGHLHLTDAKKAAEDIPKEQGDLRDDAIKLVEYVTNPAEEAAAARGLLFTSFIGGSVASALVNMTQPITMTLPYLTQFGGAVKAGKRLSAAMAMVASGKGMDAGLAAALKRAESDGIVSPQEIHHLQGAAMDSLGNKYPMLKKAAFVWGSMFSLAEQFNRRVSFVAAYHTAQQEGIANPFAFAEKAVVESQGLYNKANKPNWARGTAGAVAMTFKQFSIHYLEFLVRMWKSGPEGKKAVAVALALLILMGGAGGLPFADDLDDLIDTLGQATGHDTNSKRWKRQFVAKTLGLGDAAADVATRGVTALPGFPLDLSLRMGMGNLLPATGLFLRSNTDTSRQLLEVAGAAGGLASNVKDGVNKVLAGDVGDGIKKALPVAVQNMFKAYEMAQTGEYRNTKGAKVMDVDLADAALKLISFQPAEIARESGRVNEIMRSVQLTKNVEGEIAGRWAQAVVDGDTDGVAKARASLADWNANNPTAPIRITPQQVRARVKALKSSRADRTVKMAPKEMRGSVAEALP